MRTWTLLLLVIATGAPAQEPSLGAFDGHGDVGRTRNPGSVVYDPARDQYTIAGSGANMWFDRDDFHFVWKRLRGNFILTARAQFSGAGVEPHRKLGWTVRSDLTPGSGRLRAVPRLHREQSRDPRHGDRGPHDRVPLSRVAPGAELDQGRHGPDLQQSGPAVSLRPRGPATGGLEYGVRDQQQQ